MSAAQPIQKRFDPARVIARYPAPIAHAYVALGQSASPLESLFALKDLFEVSLKYCAIVMVQDYQRLGLKSTPVDSAIVQFLARPQLGNWNHILREIARTCQSDREQLFVPELADFYFELWGAPRRRGHELVESLIKFRNRVIAHGARPRGREAELILETTVPVIEDFLADLLFLQEYDLISVTDAGDCAVHMGTDPSVSSGDEVPQASLQSLLPGQLYLRHDVAVLPLFPLLLYQRCGCGTPPDVCELTKTFFFNGGDRRPEYVDYLMGHVKQVPAAAEAVQQIIQRSKECLSVDSQEVPAAVSAELVRDSVRGFVGRTHEEEEILRYVASRERGRVTVVGDPGVGKSALLSQVILDLTKDGEAATRSPEIAGLCSDLQQSGLAVASHICTSRVPESTSVPNILASLSTQLVRQYGPRTTAPQERSLRGLLDTARLAKTHFFGKALLIIDGIDELLAGRAPQEQREILNSLPFGELLPEGVFALISSRRGYLEHEAGEGYLLELSGLTRNDIRQLLGEVADQYAIAERHVDAVQQVSQSNALYVRMLVNDLKLGKLDLNDINRLPLGLEGYFEDFIKRLSVDDDWPVLRDCLLLVASARGHLSVNQVCAMTDFTWAEVEAAMEDKLQAVLVPVSPEVRDYQLFHEKFREFLLSLFGGKLSNEVTARLNRRFVREAPVALRAEGEVAAAIHLSRARERLLNYCRGWRELDDDYPLYNLPRHLYDAGEVNELATLLRESDFPEQKIKRFADASIVAEDVRYLTLGLLTRNRQREIVELAVSEHGYRRDGVASALRVAAPEQSDAVAAIVRVLLQRSDPSSSSFAQTWSRLRARLPGRPPPPPAIINCRRVAIEIAYRRNLGELLVRASQDDSAVVRALLVPYLYRYWNKDHEEGWRLMGLLARKVRHRTGLPSIRTIEAFGGFAIAVLIYHGDEPVVIEELQGRWRAAVRYILHMTGEPARTFMVRSVLRAAIFAMTRMLRLSMAAQPNFMPINLREIAASAKRTDGEERRLSLRVLESLEHPERGFAETIELLMNQQLPYGLLLMLVVERTLIFHGAKDPDAMFAALWRVHRDGCEWFRQSGLYIAYHTLNAGEQVEDNLLELYAQMTRETIDARRGTFQTANGTYDLLPHIAACEIIFDKYRPQGGARFIPEVYGEARRLGDLDYARRAIDASSLLSFGYRRHELALDALRPALREREPQLRRAVIEALAGIRFHAEEVVDRFLEREQVPELANLVASHTLAVKSNDIFVWIDPYVIESMNQSDWFRAELVGAFRRAAHARSLPELLQMVLKWVINLSTGEELLPL